MINRSGIEVAMHAEPERPVVLVVRDCRIATDQQRASWEDRRAKASDGTRTNVAGLQLLVQHVHAHVEVFGDIPLGARTDPPSVPVRVASDIGRGCGYEEGAGAQ